MNSERISEKEIEDHSLKLNKLRENIHETIIGQDYLIDRLLVGLLCNQHILIEGVPGLAKTLSVTTLAESLSLNFRRIQFTPDLLPADLVGTLIFNPGSGKFTTKKGPVFANLILADEINRAPAKVQSALLESMQEKQVTIGEETFPLPEPFMVLATQNPVEQEGTYPLPEAQVDRFMLKLKIDYPSRDEELRIMRERGKILLENEIKPIAEAADILKMRKIVDRVFIDPRLEEYIIDIVRATRKPEEYGLKLADLISYGASPRASIYLSLASKAVALINGRGFVTPQDIKTIGYDVLRHRVIVSYEAEAEEKSSEDLLRKIFDRLAVP